MSVIRLFRSSHRPFDAGREALQLAQSRNETVAWVTSTGVILIAPTDELSVVLRQRRRTRSNGARRASP